MGTDGRVDGRSSTCRLIGGSGTQGRGRRLFEVATAPPSRGGSTQMAFLPFRPMGRCSSVWVFDQSTSGGGWYTFGAFRNEDQIATSASIQKHRAFATNDRQTMDQRREVGLEEAAHIRECAEHVDGIGVSVTGKVPKYLRRLGHWKRKVLELYVRLQPGDSPVDFWT